MSDTKKFFAKHQRLRTLICNHPLVHDIGTIQYWDGTKDLVSQCDYCGMIRIGINSTFYPLAETRWSGIEA